LWVCFTEKVKALTCCKQIGPTTEWWLMWTAEAAGGCRQIGFRSGDAAAAPLALRATLPHIKTVDGVTCLSH